MITDIPVDAGRHPCRTSIGDLIADGAYAEHPRVPARVEHTFARMKTWKIVRDRHQGGDGLHHAVQAVAAMHNLTLAG
ncbi:transposase IS4 family protein [Streptomyces collinus Tu 365]|uniref:Transposase IS4 family protein n=1 Tax=Streptomyces collinus (strain DSM 40733 / Tue 365) TaxID=1214242 RepID=S5V1P3_STRC3|nr:transposase IS4 family protein [Streptomyces collinus Tu 365]AGS73503.1 transposase IS4 family protein [Streptomyces collinus Tu 365]